MTTLKTICTVELSNDCQLACRYCVNRKMESHAKRPRIVMSDQVFTATLYWIKKLCEAGTQQEVNMNGNGESFLDPQLFRRLRRVKEVIGPTRKLNISTNGLIMSPDVAMALKASGLDDIQVSIHRADKARMAGQVLALAGMRGSFNYGAVASPHNWANQIDEEYRVPILPDIPCHPLMEGRGYVSVEGRLSPCCYDYRLVGAFGSVFDTDLLDCKIEPFELCATCHQKIPDELLAGSGIIQPGRKSFSVGSK